AGLFGPSPFRSGPRHCGQSAAVLDAATTNGPATVSMYDSLKRWRTGFPLLENALARASVFRLTIPNERPHDPFQVTLGPLVLVSGSPPPDADPCVPGFPQGA